MTIVMKHSLHSEKSRFFTLKIWMCLIFLVFVFLGYSGANDATKKLDVVAGKTSPGDTSGAPPKSTGNKGVTPPLECAKDDKECEKDKLGLEAIRGLHLLIDDDHNGNVDQYESDEFLRDELQYTDGFERQALFHNNDKLISVDDLWKAWKHSIVYNWTVDDVIEWLVQDVDLPQYSQVFHNNAIDGSVLPRLVNSTSPLLAILGIRNPVHKQKLSLKAMDTVLFGAPKRVHSYAKDLLLVSSLIIAVGGCWFACLHHRYSQTQVRKMMKDLESLQKAEDALKKLSKELAEAEKNQLSMPHDKQEELRILRQNSVRLRMPRVNGDKSPAALSREGSIMRRKEGEMKLKQAEEELASLREALTEAENRLEIQQQLESQWSVPGELQAWLQLTHELEQVHYNAKRQAAERQLWAAKDGCDKIKKRNKAFFGSLRMAHSNSLDEIDQSILDARASLEEVKQDLQERLHRWHTIEILCGFPIISNPGLASLKQVLGRDTANNTRVSGGLLAPVSIDEADEDLPPAGYQAAPVVGVTSKPSTFLKQQAQMGSTASLTHSTKGPPAPGQMGVLGARRKSQDELQGLPLGVGHGHVSTSPVSFHLGENPPTSSPTSATRSTGVVGSPPNQGAFNTIPRAGNSMKSPIGSGKQTGSIQAKSSVHGNHVVPRPTTLAMGGPAHAVVATANANHHQGELGDIVNNNLSPQGSLRPGVGMSQSTSMVLTSHHNNHLEESDAVSLDSIPRSQSMSGMSGMQRGRLDRSPEMDMSSVDSGSLSGRKGILEEEEEEEEEREAQSPKEARPKKTSKKRKFLPNFLQKKGKQKTV